MSMSKKDYIAVAKAINSRVTFIRTNPKLDTYAMITGETAISLIADDLCLIFKADNPAFEKSRFLSACGFDQ